MSSLTKSNKTSTTFVQFKYGDPKEPTYSRICDVAEGSMFRGTDYLGEPALEVSPPKQTGGIESKPTVVRLPRQRGVHPAIDFLMQALTNTEPHSTVEMLCWELIQTGNPDDQEVVYLSEGTLRVSRRNPDRISGIVELEFYPDKSGLDDVRLGLPALPTCVFTYGGTGCSLNLDRFHDSGTYPPNHYAEIRRLYVELNQFSGQARAMQATLSIDPANPLPANTSIEHQPRDWWIGGYVERQGLAIPIRDSEWNDTLIRHTRVFNFGRLLPSSWNGEVVTLVPGCPKDLGACRTRNNEINFNGIGYSIPAYNPLAEEDNRF